MIFLNLIILFVFIIFWVRTKSYNKEIIDQLDEKQYKMKTLFPLGLYLIDKVTDIKYVKMMNKLTGKLDDSLKAIYVGEKVDIIKKFYLCNKVALALLIIFISNLFSMVSNINTDKQLFEGRYIKRPGYQENSKKVSLDVQISQEGSTLLEDEVDLEVEKKHYDDVELRKIFKYAKVYIDDNILSANETPDRIHTNLNFVKQIPDTDITVDWKTENSDLIDESGIIHNDELTEEVLTWVTAIMVYHDKKEEYTRYFCILPKVYTEEEFARKRLHESLDSIEEQSLTDDKITLPNTLGNQSVAWAEKEDRTGVIILFLGFFAAILLFIIMDRELFNKVEERNKQMLLDYSEIINKFTLLVGAGISLSNAWYRICQDYKNSKLGKRYAYEEMLITNSELMLGTSEAVAYEKFGRRTKLLPYLRFSSLISQNVKKGSAGLFEQLEFEVKEAFEERKELAKRMGEEAGTKLLGPMMCMLIIVLAIIIVPAFLSFGI